MRIREKGASLIEKSFLITLVFTTTLNGQYYSEQMRQQQTLSSAVQEPLTLQEIQAEVSQPRAQLPPQYKAETSVWTYQAEPHLINLPPHLNRFLGMLLYYSNGSVFVVYTNPQALHHHKGIRSGDRILSVNGKNVKFYKDRFFTELNEVRPNRDLLIQYETGTPAFKKIVILPNIYMPDSNLEKLLTSMNVRIDASYRKIQKSTKTLVMSPYNQSNDRGFTNYSQSTTVDTSRVNRINTDFQHFGISAQKKNDRMIVENVRPRSAAASARIRTGDEIVSIGGRPTQSLSQKEILHLTATEPVLIEWRSGQNRLPQSGYFNSSPKQKY